LGKEFNGVLGCDYFGAYRKYMRQFDVLVRFCLAHLIRDVKFLMALPDRENQAYGRRVRDSLRELFGVIHRRDKLTAADFRKALEAARQQVLKAATVRVPKRNHANNLAKRFREHGEAYFRFITTPGIEPTNNLAEQAIRFVVIDRRITLGTRSETGRRWYACDLVSYMELKDHFPPKTVFGPASNRETDRRSPRTSAGQRGPVSQYEHGARPTD